MTEHPHLATIRKYYEGCNRGDIGLMVSTFTPDVVHYFTDLNRPPGKRGPVKGALALAQYWANFQKEGRTTQWTVDHGIVEGDEAVIEWSMRSTGPDEGTRRLLRGTEWYVFKAGKIAEIRAYYHYTGREPREELSGFPYAERGYAVP
jgi:ketosteroid isomerase-like protein